MEEDSQKAEKRRMSGRGLPDKLMGNCRKVIWAIVKRGVVRLMEVVRTPEVRSCRLFVLLVNTVYSVEFMVRYEILSLT